MNAINLFLSGFNYATQISTSILKFFMVVNTVDDVKKSWDNPELTKEQKVHRIGTGMIFIIAQTTDLASSLAGRGTERVQMISRTTAAGAGIANMISRDMCKRGRLTQKEYLAIFGMAAFRIADTLDFAIARHPGAFKKTFFSGKITMTPEVADKISDLVKAASAICLNYNSIKQLPANVRGFGRTIYSIYIRIMKGEEKMTTPEQEIAMGQAFLAQVELARNIENIEQQQEIPWIFLTDPVLRLYKCPITGKPIRFIRVVSATRDGNNPVFFERDAILARMEDNNPPESWPSDVQFIVTQLSTWDFIQGQIDDRLSALVQEIQTEPEHQEEAIPV